MKDVHQESWVDDYQGLAEDANVIPLMGVRVLIGVDANGKDQFHVALDGGSGSDKIKACFMLEMARDFLKEMVLREFAAETRTVEG